MFNETSYGLGATSEPLWYQLGFASKAAWKQAGGRTTAGGSSGGVFTPPSGLPTLPGDGGVIGTGGQPIDGTITGAGGIPSSSGGIGDLLGGIPTMYLMIGAAIVLLMVLKK